jgi:RNA polymerase sigma-70 factor, ECF subfamily
MPDPVPGHSPSPKSAEIIELLALVRQGDKNAEGRLIETLYADLKKLAAYFLRAEAKAQSISPTLLVNEAYLRIFGTQAPELKDRQHFLALSSQVMRRILVDRARQRSSKKRGEGQQETLNEILIAVEDNPDQILAVDQSLSRLASFAPRAARVVEMRYFGGLEDSEIAEVLETSIRTVRRDWAMSRAWFLTNLEPLANS